MWKNTVDLSLSTSSESLWLRGCVLEHRMLERFKVRNDIFTENNTVKPVYILMDTVGQMQQISCLIDEWLLSWSIFSVKRYYLCLIVYSSQKKHKNLYCLLSNVNFGACLGCLLCPLMMMSQHHKKWSVPFRKLAFLYVSCFTFHIIQIFYSRNSGEPLIMYRSGQWWWY